MNATMSRNLIRFVAAPVAAAGIIGGAPGNAFREARVLHWDGTNNTGETSQVMAGAQWLSDHGCRVINMSLGALRDPRNRERDGFSALEAAVVAYAQRNGALVVAAVGNSDNAPATPWRARSWPTGST